MCNDSDYALLKTRVGKNANIDWTSDGWRDAPLLFYGNEAKDMFNKEAVSTYTKRNGQDLHNYYAVDKLGGMNIENIELQSTLSEFHSGQTSQRLPVLPLAIGMRVIMGYNFDVPGGVVNGTVGILKSIRYWVDDSGNQHATSCVIYAEDTSPDPLPGLPPHHVVALAEPVKIQFENKYSFKRCTITRTQLPVLPAYAFTAHKSQGQTYNKVIVDLKSCRGSAAPYVMLSRVKSLDGLCILRDFDKDKICCHMNEDCRKEIKRLNCLDLQTVLEVGSESDRNIAREELNIKYSTAEKEVATLPLSNEDDANCLQRGNGLLDQFQRTMKRAYQSSSQRKHAGHRSYTMIRSGRKRKERDPDSAHALPAMREAMASTITGISMNNIVRVRHF